VPIPARPGCRAEALQKNRWKLIGPTKLRVERVTSELPSAARRTAVLEALEAAALKQAA